MVPYYILLHEGREEIEWHHTQQMRPFTMLFNHRTLMARSATASGPADNIEGRTTTAAAAASNCNNNDNHHRNNNCEERYLRLIIRGRMMAPDGNTLAAFRIVNDDVIHAVLTIQPSIIIQRP